MTSLNGSNGGAPEQLARVVTISPEQAEEILGRPGSSDIQRNVRDDRVGKYRRDMEQGVWLLNGETLKFRGTLEGGVLRDGQHRLWACMLSGVPFRTWVVENVSEEAMGTIDTGAPRNFGDLARIDGHLNANVVASVVRWLWWYEKTDRAGKPSSKGSVSHPVLREYLASNPDVPVAVAEAVSCGATRVGPPSIIAFAYLLLRRVDARAAESWALGLAKGAGLEENDPILMIRNKLIMNRGDTRNRLEPRVLGAYVLKSAYAHLNGDAVKAFKFNEGEEFPVIRRRRGNAKR